MLLWCLLRYQQYTILSQERNNDSDKVEMLIAIVINVIYRAKSLRFKEAKSLDLSKNRLLRRVSRRKKSQSTSKQRSEDDFELGFARFGTHHYERHRF